MKKQYPFKTALPNSHKIAIYDKLVKMIVDDGDLNALNALMTYKADLSFYEEPNKIGKMFNGRCPDTAKSFQVFDNEGKFVNASLIITAQK